MLQYDIKRFDADRTLASDGVDRHTVDSSPNSQTQRGWRSVLPGGQRTHREKGISEAYALTPPHENRSNSCSFQGADHINVWAAGGDSHVFRFLRGVRSGLDMRSGITEN
jgi:hypothetical protein